MKHRKGPTRALEALVVEEQKEAVGETYWPAVNMKCNNPLCRQERFDIIEVRGPMPKVVECRVCGQRTAEIV